ncbi:hypothetical protein CO046_00670 [Candidatus Peregrinibacteria bacterium CG_4_9_14_0_2_um_filter_53_11]|nr:MAG: hypothetical protein CO046_00670 [Candidatus Peregrinibacteria bacterium CG_4_9_14_0_2_um_filter_53_11]
MSKILVCASLAYDILYTYPGIFNDSLDTTQPQLSVAFNVKERRVHFGGCAGNIVYTGVQLSSAFRLCGVVGGDFADYEAWLQKNSIETDLIVRAPDAVTSHATILTDHKGQQLIFFDEGAAALTAVHRDELTGLISRQAREGQIAALHIGPNPWSFMSSCLEAAKATGLPYFFDPGQAMPVFSKEELFEAWRGAAGIFVNEYEFALAAKTMQMDEAVLSVLNPLTVVTRGKEGSSIFWGGEELSIPPQTDGVPVDPTGCGDAYRAGFLSVIHEANYKLTHQLLERAGQRGTEAATACLRVSGTQEHRLG